jgi:DNA invertase Pin-like site-specific DNA recombinase
MLHAYIRASDKKQELSPDAQRATILAWAAREGVLVTSWHVDLATCSATPIEERPGLLACLGALRRGDTLVVAKRDRLARDVIIAASLNRQVERMGCNIVSASGEGNGSSPADEFMRTVLDGAAQYERALIRARTKSALAVLKARGFKTGGKPPYGWRADEEGRLHPVDAEQAVINRAKALREGGMGWNSIARRLGSTRSGAPFQAVQVQRMLRYSAAGNLTGAAAATP